MIKTLAPPPFCESEALRYGGCKNADETTVKLFKNCFAEVRDRLTYKVCYCEFAVQISGNICDFGSFKAESKGLAQNLDGCEKVLVFGATVGVEIDRLIAKYGRVSPAKAMVFQAIGAERIEALCDAFCKQYENENNVGLKPRFSPGYGDLSLNVQKDIFSVLDAPRKIGLSLNDSLLMSPSKSVTAFAGITDYKTNNQSNRCGLCGNTNCEFRSRL